MKKDFQDSRCARNLATWRLYRPKTSKWKKIKKVPNDNKKDNSLDTLDPLILLLFGGSRHAINGVLSLHHFTLRVSLAGLDHFVVGGEELKAVLLWPIADFSHTDIFQGDDATGLLVSSELEVVQAVVVKNKPSPFPTFVTSALFP